MAKSRKVKKRKVRVEPEGMAFVKASFNNIIISITNKSGQVISWASAGKAGFRGSKKNTPYAAQVAATDAARGTRLRSTMAPVYPGPWPSSLFLQGKFTFHLFSTPTC